MKATIQHDFPIFRNCKRLVYLDNSATSQKPRQVIDAITKFYTEENSNIHRGVHTLSIKATMAYEKSREQVAKFIDAEADEIIFTRGTTESLNFLAFALGKKLRAGDEIVLSEMEHHSNIVPWQEITKEKKVVLKFIPVTKEYRLDMKKAKEYITPKTKIVSITHMSNVLGTINPVLELARLAHTVGAMMIVDA